MFHHDKIAAALERKRGQFANYQDSLGDDLAAYRAALADLGRTLPHGAAIVARLAGTKGRVGARPLALYDDWAATAAAGAPPVALAGRQFAHHEAARAWAEGAIGGVTTAAVDGSQMMPWRDASIPVALVQAGIFANPHDGARPYLKDLHVEILTPDELMPLVEEHDIEEATVEQIVNLRRFELEARTLATWMREWRGAPGEPAPVAFFDGSLIVSFAIKLHMYLLSAYVIAMDDLLAASAESAIPLVGYIDTSSARDLTTMLRLAFPERGLRENPRLHDALIWGPSLAWGDATVPWLADRGGALAGLSPSQEAVAFLSLRAAVDRPPARLEMPRWVVERGEWRRVVDVARAEIIAGGGYPYAIETADALAVVGAEDRARFFGLFQRFASANDVPLTFSRKALSKSQRRR